MTKPLESPESALMYYTLDGSDPRLLGGGLSPSAIAYAGPIELVDTTRIRTRMLNGTTWSAIVDTTIGVLANEAPEDFLAGDYDGNGTVEAADYLFWKQSYGQTVEPYTGADGNGDGKVDAADYTVWRNNLGATNQTEPEFSFNFIGQTYTQNFDAFRGTAETLPNHFTVTVAAGTNIYRDTFDATTDTAASFTGIKAATSDGSDYSFAWRESTGAAGLEDTRVLFAFTNNTGEAITGFEVSYDVEAWVNGRRDNQIRFKYDIYADTAASQAAEGRSAFETDIFATVNPNHTPIAANGDQFVLDGKDGANRVTVSGYVDLLTLLVHEGNPGLGVFGALQPGETAYFRWQISNAFLSDGNRSALAIDNLSITALAMAPAAGGGSLALFSEAGQAQPLTASPAALPPERNAALDLALADWTRTTPTTPTSSLLGAPTPIASAALDDLLLVALRGSQVRHSDAGDFLASDVAGEDTEEHDELFAELAATGPLYSVGDF
ncbi:MAG TPA: dockerin type I domain-containing protein [Lacipirellulaceae bacterium]|nr:dockerin type I domain-containing protein [Lacipirellulaceae bacterium]